MPSISQRGISDIHVLCYFEVGYVLAVKPAVELATDLVVEELSERVSLAADESTNDLGRDMVVGVGLSADELHQELILSAMVPDTLDDIGLGALDHDLVRILEFTHDDPAFLFVSPSHVSNLDYVV